MAHHDPVQDLLRDLATLTERAQAGVFVEDVPRLREGEVRPAAVLYLDVVGFTALSRRLSAEQLATLIDRTFKLFELDVLRFGGYRDDVIGDAAMFVFLGDPSQPPPAEGAIQAGLAILDRTTQINDSLAAQDLAIAVRVGVSYGEVTRRMVAGKRTIMGDTVNLAQRLESTAEPGSLLCSAEALRGHEEGFEWRGPTTLDLKGIGRTEAFRVDAVRRGRIRLRGRGSELTPLVGREALLVRAVEQVRDWWRTRYPDDTLDLAATGTRVPRRGRLLLLTGPAAVGKSRLAWEIGARLVEPDGARIATTHCLPTGGGTISFATGLASLGGLNAAELPERYEALLTRAAEAMSADYAERQRRHLPVLAYLLQSDRVDTAGIRQADPETFETAVTLAIRGLCELVHHATSQPVVLVVEDLQWLGDEEDLLADLLNHAALHVPLVVIGTARSGYELGEVLRHACELEAFELASLGEADARAVVESRLPGVELPERLWADLLEKAQGLPYFLEEFADLLEHHGYVQPDDTGAWRLVRSVESLVVPDDVRALVLGRLDTLPRELRELTGHASVLGRSFFLRLLAAIEARLALDDATELEDLLLALVDEHVLAWEPSDAESTATPPAPTPERYFFHHELTREAAYSALLAHNRRLLHSLAADCLQALHPEGSPGELDALMDSASHFEHAGRLPEALDALTRWLRIAVAMGHRGGWDRAWQNAFALAEAVDWSAEARRAGTGSVDGEWAAPMELEFVPAPPLAPDQALRAAALIDLALVRIAELMRQGRAERETARTAALALASHPLAQGKDARTVNVLRSVSQSLMQLPTEADVREEARQHVESALALARQLGDRRSEALCLTGLAGLSHRAADWMEGRTLAERSLEIFRELGNRRLEGAVLHNIGLYAYYLADTDAATAAFRAALVAERATGDVLGEGFTLMMLGLVELDAGDMEQAQEHLEQALALDRQVGNRAGEANAAGILGRLRLELGHLEAARHAFESELELSRMIGDLDTESSANRGLGRLSYLSGRFTEALASFDESLRCSRQAGIQREVALTLSHVGRLRLASDHLTEARRALDEALSICHQGKSVRAEGGILRSLADLERLEGNLPVAREHLERAEERLTALNLRHELALTHATWARLHHDLGDDVAARERLAAADAIARRMGVGPESELGRLIVAVGAELGGGDGAS